MDAALGVPDQYVALTAGGGSGSGGCVERRPHRRGGSGRVVGGAAGGGNPLLSARNCLVTPHIAWATKETRSRLLDLVVENIAAFLAGKPRNVMG